MPRTKTKPIQGRVPYIDRADKLAAVAQHLSEQPVIAFDTEFIWERTYAPRLGLIQVADDESVWLVDPVALSAKDMRPLLDVLVSPDSLKVAHAIDQDQMCLHCSYGIVAEPVLDTAIAAALVGMGDQIGLSKLLNRLLHVGIDKGYSRTNWLKRPLPRAMREYAAGDVRYLTRASGILRKRLRKLSREDWALNLSDKVGDFAKAHFNAESLALRIATNRRLDERTFAVLKELMIWRERQASHRNIPRRWLAEDKMLVKLATARPRRAKQLADFRGLGIGKHPKSAERVLKAIRRGQQAKPDGYVRPKRAKSVTPKESAALVVLRCFLNTLAANNKVPLRLLIENDQMIGLLRGKFSDVETLRKSGVLDRRVVDLVGEDLVAILNGQRGLYLVNGVATQLKN